MRKGVIGSLIVTLEMVLWKGDRRRCGVMGKGILQKRCARPIVF